MASPTIRSRIAGMSSVERVVVLLMPVFMAGGGYVSTEVATLTNVQIPGRDFTAIFIAGVLGAAAGVLKWLHGRQKFVAFTDESKATLEKAVQEVRAELAANAPAQAAVDDIGSLLKSHEQDILDAFDKHVPNLVGQVLANLLSGAVKKPPQEAPRAQGPAPGQVANVGGGQVPLA